MKRFLWLACIGCCCSLAVVACGDDDDGNSGDGGTEDGGSSTAGNGGGNINKQLNDLKDDVEMGLDDANDKIEDANGKIDDLNDQAADLAGRLDALEEIKNCSENQSCVPDGVGITAMGLASIIEQLCTLEINCCSADELNYKFGPGITSVAECTQTFTDLVNNGQTPSFLSQNGVIINRVIQIAQAINSNDVQVSIDAAAVKACVDYLSKRECDKYTTPPEVVEITHCEVIDYSESDDPCDLSLLVKGAQQEGDLCGITTLNECASPLVCRAVPGSQFGICAQASKIDEGCRSDADCDGEEQFCNLSTGKCQGRGDVDDDCEYVDPTFTYGLSPSIIGGWQNPAAMKVECKRGLICDPTTNKCVSNCSTGALCYANVNCPEGQVCNFTAVPGLRNMGQGVCTAPIAKDELCTCNANNAPNGNGTKCMINLGNGLQEEVSTQCATGRCLYDGVDQRFECADALKAEGASCTLATAGIPQVDATCITGVCGGDGKCAKLCSSDSQCATGFYCDMYGDPYSYTPLVSECEPKKANDLKCYQFHTVGFDNIECTSGYCDASLSLCKDKIAVSSACPTSLPIDACANSWCRYDSGGGTYTCTAFVAAGGACVQDRECGPGAYCGTLGTNAQKCVAYVAAGGACDQTVNDIRCNDTVAAPLSCAITAAPNGVCAAPTMFPNGAHCSDDSQCANHWCRQSDGTCQTPLAEGEDCNVMDEAKDHCVEGTYCNFPNLHPSDPKYGGGACAAVGTAGKPCDPRFGGDDCIGDCDLRNDQFVCDPDSLVEETLFCDGE